MTGYLKNLTPEQRAEYGRRAAETRRAKKIEQLRAQYRAEIENPPATDSPESSQRLVPPVPAGGSRDERYGLPPDVVARKRAEARARVEAEIAQRERLASKDAEDIILREETERLRREVGLTDSGDDIVMYTVNVPPTHKGHIRDGVLYEQGYTYPLPRRVAECMREDEARAWDNEDRVGNPNKNRYHREYTARGGLTQNPFTFLERDGDAFVHGRAAINARTGATFAAPSEDPVAAVARMVR